MPNLQELGPQFAALSTKFANDLLALAATATPTETAPIGTTIAAIRTAAREGLEVRSDNVRVEIQNMSGQWQPVLTLKGAKSKAWTTHKLPAPITALGWRMVFPDGSYGNTKAQALDAKGKVLTGKSYGPTGSYNNNKAATYEQALSDDLGKFFDAAVAKPDPVGQEFSAQATPTPAPIQTALPTLAGEFDSTTGIILVRYSK